MKNKSQAIIKNFNNRIIKLIYLTLIFTIIRSEAQVSCNLKSTDSILTNIASSSCGGICTPLKYIPETNDSVLYIRLYFHFILPVADSGNFRYVTESNVSNIVSHLNIFYDSLPIPQLLFYPTPQYIKKSKIQFVLYNWQKHIDPNAWLLPNPYEQSGHLDTSNYDQYRDPNALNIIFTKVTGYSNPHANGIPSSMIGILTPSNVNSYFNWLAYPQLLAHEIGHCLGLQHTDSLHHNIAWQSVFPSNACFTRDYVSEGAAVYGYNGTCISTDHSSSNNLMGQHFNCVQYLSPNQLAIARYNLLNYPPLFKTLANVDDINNSSNSIFVNSAYDTTIYSSLTWNHDRYSKGNVIVKSGATLRIRTCDQTFRGNAKIIVEPGGRLYIHGRTLKSYSALPWGGIEIWGYNGAIQDTVNQGKVRMLSDDATAKIINARYGITAGKRFSNTSIDYSKTGGIVQVESSFFENNFMDIDLQPYVWYSSSGPVSNQSFMKYNWFVGDRTKNGLVKNICVNLHGVYGLNIIGNEFKSDGGNPLILNEKAVQVGIYSLNSNFIAKAVNYFRYFRHGIVAQNPGNITWPVSIDHNVFIGNIETGVVLYNSIGSNVTNNNFLEYNNNQASNPCTGLYLFENTNYKVENNLFQGTYNASHNYANQIGMYVKNSGPYSNNVYNNTFNYLQQGLFPIGYNWDHLTGLGLRMNCNDFQNSTYNIAVMDVPYGTYGVDWTGVDRVQGLASGINDQLRVRNTYSVTNCGAVDLENKFYMYAFNNSITNYFYIFSHGNYPASQFKPTPNLYQSCSDSSEVVVYNAGSTPSGAKSTYCQILHLSKHSQNRNYIPK